MAVRLDQNTCHNVAWVPHTAALGPSAAWGTQVASFSVKQRKFQICILIGIAIMFGPAGATQAPTDTLSMMSGQPCHMNSQRNVAENLEKKILKTKKQNSLKLGDVRHFVYDTFGLGDLGVRGSFMYLKVCIGLAD